MAARRTTSHSTSPQQGGGAADELPPTAWAVLGLLSFPGERTGYELKKWADASLRFFYWSPAISQIYAELRRLEALGYATSRRSGPEEPRAKRSYAITEEGRAALAAWAGGGRDAGPPVLKHPLLLRVWLGHLTAPDHLRALVAEHIAQTERELAEVREALALATGSEAWSHPQVALRWSERRLVAEVELAEAMLGDLVGRGAAGASADPAQGAPGTSMDPAQGAPHASADPAQGAPDASADPAQGAPDASADPAPGAPERAPDPAPAALAPPVPRQTHPPRKEQPPHPPRQPSEDAPTPG
ncbi:helix-turn-helix transcriptional regulator [Streptomyces sp. NPDC005918]|uniref:helix-turn-helix transcriptional regulator n=1 Tax=Streptomyces sp. NPDC005918 TaxID=3155454 RepID=UPI0033E657B7